LSLQLSLAEQIPFGEGCVERPFPEIGRIADVTWETRKIVYEIQCSPLSVEEAQKRSEDYRAAGWQLIWILSDKTFNRKRLSAAEAYLRKETSYFSHWEKRGVKKIYDQGEILVGSRRLYQSPPIIVHPLQALKHSSERAPFCSLPLCLQERWNSWSLRVEKDILTQLCTHEPYLLAQLREKEKQLGEQQVVQRLPWVILFKKIYLHFFKKFTALLE